MRAAAPKNVMITSMEPLYSQEPIKHDYIATVFWEKHIAQVSKITILPYTKQDETYYMAYINIKEWCDTESAYNFIHRLNDPTKETRLVHRDDEWWSVEINTHNNGELNVGNYTVNFDDSFFLRDPDNKEDDDDDHVEEEELEEGEVREDDGNEYGPSPTTVTFGGAMTPAIHPEELIDNTERIIRGTDNIYYSVNQVLEQLEHLNTFWMNVTEPEIRLQIETEMIYLSRELNAYQNNYQNNYIMEQKVNADNDWIHYDDLPMSVDELYISDSDI